MGKRTILLPGYLADNPAWTDMSTAMDGVWVDSIDLPMEALRKVRELYLLNDDTRAKIDALQMLDPSDFDQFEKSVLVKQVNMLGMQLLSTDLLQDADFARLFQNLGKFWYSKGTAKFIDFIGFCIMQH